jgi:hypothetical protein
MAMAMALETMSPNESLMLLFIDCALSTIIGDKTVARALLFYGPQLFSFCWRPTHRHPD